MKELLTKQDIGNWLTQQRIKNFKILDDLSVDVTGSVFLNGRLSPSVLSLPVKFNRVLGNFSCYESRLHTLHNFPNFVSGQLDIHKNKITSLEGCTPIVGEHFNCSENKLTSLKGGPTQVGGSYNCMRNEITSLEGAPLIIKGNFLTASNKLTTLAGLEEVKGRVNCSANPLTTFVGSPRMTGLVASNTLITSLEGLQIPGLEKAFLISHKQGFIIPEIAAYYKMGPSKNEVILRSESEVKSLVDKLLLDKAIILINNPSDNPNYTPRKIKI